MLWGAITLIAGLVTGGNQASVPVRDVWITREFRTMGTVLHIDVAAGSRTSALAASEAAFRAVQRVDGAISSWRSDSDVGRLNVSAPHSTLHAPELAAVLEELAVWSAETDGAFDPVVGALIETWDLRGAGRYPSAEEVTAALERTGMRHLRIDAARDVLEWTVGGAWVDAGGFGKGMALRAAKAALDSVGVTMARLNFGGQTLAVGPDARDTWSIEIAHPANRSRTVTTLRLQDASAATSGQSERHRELDGRVLGHIIDPRTGYPVRPWGSVTVVSADPMAADILATALFVMGPDAAMAWAQERQDVGVLTLEVVDDDLVHRTNHVMEQLLQ
jgi:thiamine biosynthesis lipoprotein